MFKTHRLTLSVKCNYIRVISLLRLSIKCRCFSLPEQKSRNEDTLVIRFYKIVREVSPPAVQHMYISNNWNICGLEPNVDLAAC